MIPFEKYHGCGNSFIIVEEQHVTNIELANLAISMCNQATGIGADGLIVVKLPLEMIFYNEDGSRAPMCGNGIRCFAKYVVDHDLVDTSSFDVITLSGVLQVRETPIGFEIDMGAPSYDANLLHMQSIEKVEAYTIDAYALHSVFVGTIHTVMFLEPQQEIDVEKVGAYLCNHPYYQEKSNINFVRVIDETTLQVITYERGVGLTDACGTGCCASFHIAHTMKKVKNKIAVELKYGTLHLSYRGDHILMEGPASFIARGTYESEDKRC